MIVVAFQTTNFAKIVSMTKAHIAVLLILLAVSISAVAQSAPYKAKLDQIFDELESNDRMMGSILITKEGKPIYSRELGFRDLSGKVKSDPATMFRIGSITKPFTAVLIFKLIEEKKLNLDTKLSAFFPKIGNADQITIAHMLSHSSGIASFPQNVRYDDPKSWIFQPQTKEAMLERFAAAKPIFAPGERRQYSNTNYALLGYIIEAVTGAPYSEALEKNITSKIGLTRTRFGGKVVPMRNEAHSYFWEEGKWNLNSEEDLSNAGGAGAMVSTNADLARFIYTLFTSTKILNANSQKEMTTPFLDKFENSTKGIGVGTIEVGQLKKRVFQHDGGIDGLLSLLTYVPEDKLAVSIIINGHNYPIRKIFRAVLAVYYDQPVETPSFKVIKLSDASLAAREGSYSFKEIGMTISVKKGKENLIVQANGQDSFVCEPISESSFANRESGIIIEFKKNADGYPVFDLYQQRNSLRFLKDK